MTNYLLERAYELGLTLKVEGSQYRCKDNGLNLVFTRKGVFDNATGKGFENSEKSVFFFEKWLFSQGVIASEPKFEKPAFSEKKAKYTTAQRFEYFAKFKNTSSNFHTFCQNLGIPKAHLRHWNVGTFLAKDGKEFTTFLAYDTQKQPLYAKKVSYLTIGKRNKAINASTVKVELGCFGEHLFDPTKETIVLESEKSVVICKYFYPQFNYLATGGANMHENYFATANRLKAKFADHELKFYLFADNDNPGINLGKVINLPTYLPTTDHNGNDAADSIIDIIQAKQSLATDIFSLVWKPFEGKLQDKYLTNDFSFGKHFWNVWQNFLENSATILGLVCPTGVGKTTFILENLHKFRKKNENKVYFFAPRLTNTQDVLARANRLGLTAYVVSSDFTEKTNIQENGVDFQSANLIISTYQSFSKLASQITPDDVLIFDEFHALTENANLLIYNKLRDNKSLFISATPNKNTEKFFGKNLFQIIKAKPAKEQTANFQVSNFENIGQIVRFLKEQTGRILVQFDSKKQANYFAKLLPDSAVFTSENKLDWHSQVIENQTFGNAKYILCTSVISAGIDIKDDNFNKVVFVQFGEKLHLHTTNNMVQFANRLRATKLDMVLFRNGKTAKPFKFGTSYNRLYQAASIFANETNLELKKRHDFSNFDFGLENEKNYFKISNFASFDSLEKKYAVNPIAILSYLEKVEFWANSNENLAEEIEQYGYIFKPFSFDFEDFTKEKLAHKELVSLNTKIENEIIKNDLAMVEILDRDEFEIFASQNPKNQAVKRIIKVQSIIEKTTAVRNDMDEICTFNGFRRAKELVLAHPDRKKFGILLSKIGLEYLVFSEIITPKEKTQKNVLHAFLKIVNTIVNENVNSFNYVDLNAKLNKVLKTVISEKGYRFSNELFGSAYKICDLLGMITKVKINGQNEYTIGQIRL